MVTRPSKDPETGIDRKGGLWGARDLLDIVRGHFGNRRAAFSLLTNVFAVWLLRGSTLICRFLLTVFAVRMLTMGDFGSYGLLTAAVATGVYLLGLQFFTFNLREISSTDDPVLQARHIRDQLVFHGCGYAGLLLLYFVLHSGLGWEVNPWLVVLLPAEHLSQEGYRLLVAFSRLRTANAIFFIRSGLWILLWISHGLLTGAATLKSLCLFWFGGAALSTVITVLALRSLPWKDAAGSPVDWTWIRRGLKTCAVYSGVVVFFAGVQYTSRYVLDHSHGAAAVGVFFFFVSMASPVYTLVEVGPYSALQPQLLRLYPRQMAEYRGKFRMLGVGVVLSGLVATAAMVAVTAVYLHLNPRADLQGSLAAFGWICAGSLLSSFVLIPQAHLFTLRQDHLILGVNFLAMVTAVLSSLWLIPRFGVLGAAWSGALTSAILLVFTTVLARRRWEAGA